MILNYFRVDLSWKDGIPKIKFIPIATKVKSKVPLRPNSNMPYSAMERQYYTIFGDGVDVDTLYMQRKMLAPKTKLIEWYLHNVECDDAIRDKLDCALRNIKQNISNSLKKHYSSEAGKETKQKLKHRSEKWAPIIGDMNKRKWENSEWAANEVARRHSSGQYERNRESNKKTYADKQFMEWFTEQVNSPERIAKISNTSKALWQTPEYVKKVLGQAKNKNVTINGYKMNMPESVVASILNDLGIVWEYEQPIRVDKKTYIPDFILKDKKVIIEVFGDFWHANPKNYDADDLIFSTKRAKDIWEKDAIKKQVLENLGYTVYIVWQDDINSQYDKVEELLHEIC
jgi:G:T-mismatch repair DNA endonuclease (very short patch repair protein)